MPEKVPYRCVQHHASVETPTVPWASIFALFTVDLSLAHPRAAASLGSLCSAPPCSTLNGLPKLCLLSGTVCISLAAALLASLSLGDFVDFADPAPQWQAKALSCKASEHLLR